MRPQNGCLSLSAAIPRGWFLAGSKPADYEVAVDREAEYSHYASVVLRATKAAVAGFGTVMQQFRADNFRGSGFVLLEVLKQRTFKSGGTLHEGESRQIRGRI
jgi:hypothetical protein